MRSPVELVRRRPGAADAVLAVALAALAELEIWTSAAPYIPKPIAAVAAGLALLALAWRRRAPLASAAVSLGAVAAVALFWRVEGLWAVPALAIPVYSLAAHASSRRAMIGAGGALAVMALVTLAEDNRNLSEFLSNFLFIAAMAVGAPWFAGRMLRSRAEHAVVLRREGAERARAAVAEERMRIARELHDVVGHALGVIVVQAGAERATLPEDRPATRETLLVIEQTGREALGEMRRLLDMLRRDDDEVALAPQPSLSQLDALVTSVRAAGLPVELRVEGEPAPLPPGIDLSAFRIVQEALTNALKHAGPARARVIVRYASDGLELDIGDDGTSGEDAGIAGGGHGLLGMRERVSLYGGSLRAGAQPGGGYRVRVRLPYQAASR
jgi:signal transduction histidine kinase